METRNAKPGREFGHDASIQPYADGLPDSWSDVSAVRASCYNTHDSFSSAATVTASVAGSGRAQPDRDWFNVTADVCVCVCVCVF